MEKLGNYFNSELNKYIGEELPKVMTSIDLDLFQIKIERKIIRFAEYKHDKEKIGFQQNKALQIVSKIAKQVNDNPIQFDGWKIQVLLIRGDYPYNSIEVYDFISNMTYQITEKGSINDFLCLSKL